MRYCILALSLIFAGLKATAFEIQDKARFGTESASQTLDIISTADIDFFEATILSYLTLNPDHAVEYTVVSSTELMRAIEDEGQTFDIAISSAMDLQTKLANDGLVQPHQSDTVQSLPDWAVWNDMVFAFTQEPAAIILSNAAFQDIPIPQNRQQLIRTLRDNPELFRGKIGTYDIRQSGLGYLFATQDARASETYWRLMEVFGSLDVRMYCCSSTMIDEVVTGELAVAYNVLGSYADGRSDQEAFTTLLPTDFTTVMLRSVLIPTTSSKPDLAKKFVDHVLSQTFQNGVFKAPEVSTLTAASDSTLRRIRLGPALLVYLDRFKSKRFIEEWENAIFQ